MVLLVVTTPIVVQASELMCTQSHSLWLRLQIIASCVNLTVSGASCSTSPRHVTNGQDLEALFGAQWSVLID